MDILSLEKNLCIIEIENSSYCNRKCSYCSNFYLQRSDDNIFLPYELFKKIIDELASFDYCREITFHRYNEPFYEQNEEILKRISYARRKLPNAILETSTNGDYVDQFYLCKIQKAGLDKLYIQCHVEKFSDFSRDEIHKRILDMNHKIGNYRGKFFDSYKKSVYVTLDSEFKTLTIQSEDFSFEGFTRGEIVTALATKEVTGVCYQPLISVTIDYNGNATLCSNTLSYYIPHKEYVLGNIKDFTLKELYCSEKAVHYREKLLNAEREWICKHCRAHYTNRAKKNNVVEE